MFYQLEIVDLGVKILSAVKDRAVESGCMSHRHGFSFYRPRLPLLEIARTHSARNIASVRAGGSTCKPWHVLGHLRVLRCCVRVTSLDRIHMLSRAVLDPVHLTQQSELREEPYGHIGELACIALSLFAVPERYLHIQISPSASVKKPASAVVSR
jgi:hypothetical protein